MGEGDKGTSSISPSSFSAVGRTASASCVLGGETTWAGREKSSEAFPLLGARENGLPAAGLEKRLEAVELAVEPVVESVRERPIGCPGGGENTLEALEPAVESVTARFCSGCPGGVLS